MPNSSLGVPGGRHAQGPNFQEADLPLPARGVDLQEAVTPQPASGSAP